MRFVRLPIVLVTVLTLGAVGQNAPSPTPAATPQSAPAATAPPAPGTSTSNAVYRGSATEVIVPVTVTDAKGKFVINLEAKDFELWDNGKRQTLTYFSRERNQPIVIGFLIDLSNSNRLQWDKFREVIQELILATLTPEGKRDDRFAGYLIGYSSTPELLVNTTQDPEVMLEKVRAMKPGGGAALYDALYMACTSRTLVKGEPIEPRRVMVVVGDGHDSASKKTLDEVLELAQRNLVTIYGVSTKAFGFSSEGDLPLQHLTSATGGRVVYPLENVYKDVDGYLSKPQDAGNFSIVVGTGGYSAALLNGLAQAIESTAGEIQLQYILRYTPSENDSPKSFRKVSVRVNLPNVTVRAREGYFPRPMQ
jgi:VWFA-related protein